MTATTAMTVGVPRRGVCEAIGAALQRVPE
jgi:hypothetical protein